MARNEKVSVFLKECLADALLAKMKEKPFHKITIDEIAETAGVGRATYFRHFSSKQELLTYKVIRHWEVNAEKRNLKERHKFDIANAVDFFEINLLLREVLDAIYAAGLQAALSDAFYDVMVPDQNEAPFVRYREQFYSYALFGVLDAWIRDGYRKSPQEMADMLNEIMKT